jgi:hypothetical protein
MKKQRSIRPGVENLEHKVVMSAGVTSHLTEHAQVHAIHIDAAVHLTGYVYTGTGTVMPMGGVHGTLNVGQKVITLANGAGSVKLQLKQVHKYPNTLTARAYKILKGTGIFRSYRGQGQTSLTAVTVGRRPTVWSASFY